jgi:hypothetical protein
MGRKILTFIFKNNIILVITIALLASVFTLASYEYQRFGPEYGYRGSECKPDCVVFKLNAGWPFPYVFDSLGISVMDNLGAEDEFREVPFVLDIFFYSCLLFIIVHFLRQVRSNKELLVKETMRKSLVVLLVSIVVMILTVFTCSHLPLPRIFFVLLSWGQ